MSACWECRHPEAEHRGGLGCTHEARSEWTTHHSDGSISAQVNLSVCGCPYFKGT